MSRFPCLTVALPWRRLSRRWTCSFRSRSSRRGSLRSSSSRCRGKAASTSPRRALLRALRAICDEHGILLIADEIQSGFGRTGRLYAVEHSEVAPDIVTVAKALAGGLPLAAVVGRAALMDFLEPGSFGSTFGGSPVACATALAVIDTLEHEDLLARAHLIGGHIRTYLGELENSHRPAPLANIRGLGAMVGFDVTDPRTGNPDGRTAREVVARAFDGGLVVLSCGFNGETVRILVPLTVSDELLEEGLGVLKRALTGRAG